MTEERPPSDQAAAGIPGAEPATDPGPGLGSSGADLERRNFFRLFSREAVQTAATVVGAASAVRKGTTAAAVELLGLGIAPDAGADRLAAALGFADSRSPVGVGGRSPYRLDGERIVVLDQRRLPGEVVESSCASGAEVAGIIREGGIGPGPVLGPLAAYAMALAADRNVASRPFVRSATLRGTANALRNARPDSGDLDAALVRVTAAWERALAEHPDGERADPAAGTAIAAAIRSEADAIAMETMTGLAALVERGSTFLPQPVDRPLEVVTIGATGPLSAGVIGTAAGVIAAVAAAGRPVHAWVMEARPSRAGARIGAAELQAFDVPVTVIADGAIGWLFSSRSIDAVLVGADRVAANGDVANLAGTYPLAALAARHGVPFYVCALRSTVSATAATGAELSIVMRGRQELVSLPGEPTSDTVDARVPLSDITPAQLVSAYMTDGGVVPAPLATVEPADAPSPTASSGPG